MKPEPARIEDLAGIRQLLADASLPHEDLTAPLLEDFIVIRSGREIAGSAGIERFGSDGLLRSVAVRPPFRSRGWGIALVEDIEKHSAASHVRSLYLLTTTAADFFARRGYRRIERERVPGSVRTSREFTSLCPASAVCMTKPLG